MILVKKYEAASMFFVLIFFENKLRPHFMLIIFLQPEKCGSLNHQQLMLCFSTAWGFSTKVLTITLLCGTSWCKLIMFLSDYFQAAELSH